MNTMVKNTAFLPLYDNPLHSETLATKSFSHSSYSPPHGASHQVIIPQPCINKQATVKRKSSLKAPNNVSDKVEQSTPPKKVRWKTPDSVNIMPLRNALSGLSLTPQDTEQPMIFTFEQPSAPYIVALTPHHKTSYDAPQLWHEITRANLHYLLKIFPESPSSQRSSDLSTAKGAQKAQHHIAHENAFVSTSLLSIPHQSPTPSKHCGQSCHPTTSRPNNHAVSAMSHAHTRVQAVSTMVQSNNHEHEDLDECHLTAKKPAIPQAALSSHDVIISQVAKRTGGMERRNSLEGPTPHAGIKRKRKNETCNSTIHPSKMARDNSNSPKSSHHTSDSPEAWTWNSHSPHMRHSRLHTASYDSHQEAVHHVSSTRLTKVTVISWANQLGSAAYLRDMGKSGGKLCDSLVSLLSTIKMHQGHPELTLRMLMETKLAIQIQRFVDHTSSSPESILANEINNHWQNSFGESLGV